MMTQEPTFPCPKCGQLFPMNQLHNHWNTCQGQMIRNTYPNQALYHQFNPPNAQYPPQQNPFPQPQYQAPAPMYVPPPQKHQHIWYENDTYKVCLDQSCKQINLKLRGSLFIFLRYGLKIFWIETVVAIGLGLYVISLIHH